MKKLLSIILICFCVLSVVGCSNSNGNGNGTKDSVTYYKDFKFLPEYPGAKLKEYVPPEDEALMGKGIYTISDSDLKAASEKYKDILEKDGWEVTLESDTYFLDCKKGDHTAAILLSEKNNEPTIEILAK